MERYEEIERSIIKTYRKSIWRKFIKSINEYKMMNEGDKIAVCISGSAKSTLLAKCAQEIHRHGVVKFDLEFITADTGFTEEKRQKIEDNAKLLNIPLEIFKAEGGITDSLLKKAQSMGCNKIALGHHFDDVIEAILENLLRKGKIAAPLPKEKAGNGMELIRPLYIVKEKDVNAWANRAAMEFTADTEKNGEMKSLIKAFRKTSPYIDKNIMGSMQDVNLSTLIGYHDKEREYNFLYDYDERGKENV